MIVPACRKFFEAERFDAAKIGETFSVDSGLGGSFTVEFRGVDPDGLFLFHRRAFQDWPAADYCFSRKDVVRKVYILVPDPASDW